MFGRKQKETAYSPSQNFNMYLEKYPDGHTKTYIITRVLEQIDWYNKKSQRNQKLFKRWMIASIILSGLIPILTILVDLSWFSTIIKVLIATISSSVTAISAVMSLYHFQDLWIQYRSNCEILQSTLHRYFTKTGEFRNCSEDKSLEILVMSCEEYMMKEFQTWVASNTPKADTQKTDDQSSTNS